MHVQSCCFANLNLLRFSILVAVDIVVAQESLLLLSKNFATMVTLRHTSPICYLVAIRLLGGELTSWWRVDLLVAS